MIVNEDERTMTRDKIMIGYNHIIEKSKKFRKQ
jgi:hypothetical protein